MVTAKGFVAFEFWDNAFKQMTSSKKPLIVPEDARGQKFRIMSSKVLEAQFLAVGAIPQVMPFSEVYSALQQGVIDAEENTNSNIYTKKFYEVQKYMSVSNHGYLGYLVVMSRRFWNSLPDDLKKAVRRALREATEKERKYALELDKKQFGKIKAYADKTGKLQITVLDPEQISRWKKAMESIYPRFYDPSLIGRDLIETAMKTK
jgi:C4-dicarboxylate-binding protein DctP